MAERVLILVPTTGYQTEAFVEAARRLGVTAVLGTDRCHVLAEVWSDEAFGFSLPLNFRDPEEAAAEIAGAARARPLQAVIPTDETTAAIAARAAHRLGLGGNSVVSVERARNKQLLRDALAAAGIPTPRGASFDLDADPEVLARRVALPCVLKPLLLSASQGVIRADDEAAFVAAWRRIAALLDTPKLRAVSDPAGHRIRVEEFIRGPEVALEGILGRGGLEVLALFDKPDPLDGPYFEESLYVTPSRQAPAIQASVTETTARAAAAMGLSDGPIHAELRLGPRGAVVIEVAARSIGGLCSRALRFGLGGTSLEEVVLGHALGRELGRLSLAGASGVMMIPIPRGGVLKQVGGVEAAKAVAGVEDVVVTVRPGEVLVPLPEGSSYLGFIFARAREPAEVEAALRQAHRHLQFEIAPTLPASRGSKVES